jgi:lysophospholipase L1-like esterase
MKTMFLRKTYTKIIWAGLAFFILANSTNSQTSKIRMAFIGNSITQGVYAQGKSDSQVSYVMQFSNLMKEVYGDTLEIMNAGVSGRTLTKHGPAPIWNEAIYKKALVFVPDICLVALGTNDSKPILYDLVQNEFYNDYQDMIDTFRYVNPSITFVICLPPPIWDGHPYSKTSPHNDTLLVKYTIPLIDSIARKNDLFVVDFHTPFVDSLQYFTDHLHPNIEGHKKMAKILFDKFIEEDFIHKILGLKDDDQKRKK